MTRQQRAIMIGLMLGMICNVFEMSVVGTAMPRVVATLGGFDLYNWVFSAFMLTSTVTLPIFGKLGDQFGRKWVYIGGLIVFLLGSGLCGFARSMEFLIFARAVQGLGAGAMFPSTMAIVGEIFSPAERGRAASYFGPLFLMGGLLGPILGGFIVDYLGWRWVFFASLPFGLATLAVMFFVMPPSPRHGGHPYLDVIGAGLLIAATTPLLLVTKYLDEGMAWSSPLVAGLIAFSLTCTALFILQESRAPSPIMPLSMLRMPVFRVCAATEFLESCVLMSANMMLPVMAQGVLGLSASATGALMTPYMFVVVGANMATGQLITKLGRYRLLAVTGFAVQSVGLVGLALLPPGASWAHIPPGLLMAVGTGMLIPIYTIVVQNAVPKKQIGTATAGMQFFAQMGEAIGVTAIGVAFTAVLNRSLPAGVTAATAEGARDLFRPEALAQLAAPVVEQLRHALAVAFVYVYWMWAALAIAALVLTVLKLEDVPLRRDLDEDAAAAIK